MPFYDVDINDTIRQDFLEYTGHVMQERAIPDARDCLKDGARKILYSQYLHKNDHKHNFIKGQAATGRVLEDGYLHGDTSAYDSMVRMGKEFVFPYVFEEIQGNGGNRQNSSNHAAGRYLEIRQSELASYLFNGIEKDSIDEWYWNYSNTLELPRVLPSIGFYPIVNGATGISVGLSTSIPSTNLREVNEALIKLIKNPEIDFDEIYCAPDFPTGGTITNGKEVKESMMNGHGSSICIKAKLEYDPEKNMIIATEIPFTIYTNTVCREIAELINSDDDCEILTYLDGTNDTDGSLIQIPLKKNANVGNAMRKLYKSTSLQSHYDVNMIMLEKGRFPRVFPWKEALLNYIEHIRVCKRKEHEYDLNKYLARLNILDGFIIAAANIDDIISIIRASEDSAEAGKKLVAKYGFNEPQLKAILSMRLSSLTKIDAVKVEEEKKELESKVDFLNDVLKNPIKIDEELIDILKEVAEKFGRERRTKIINENDIDESLIEERNITVSYLSNNSLKISYEEINGGEKKTKGKKLNYGKGISVLDAITCSNKDKLFFITEQGRLYCLNLSRADSDVNLYDEFTFNKNDKIIKIFSFKNSSFYPYLFMTTKYGNVKKLDITDVNTSMKKGAQIFKLKDDDSIVSCFFLRSDNDRVVICSRKGNYIFFQSSAVSISGKGAGGVKGISLEEDDEVVCSIPIWDSYSYDSIMTISKDGKGKRTLLENFTLTGKGGKGKTIQKFDEGDYLECVSSIQTVTEKMLLFSGDKVVKIPVKDIPEQGLSTKGSSLIKKTTTIKIMEEKL